MRPRGEADEGFDEYEEYEADDDDGGASRPRTPTMSAEEQRRWAATAEAMEREEDIARQHAREAAARRTNKKPK